MLHFDFIHGILHKALLLNLRDPKKGEFGSPISTERLVQRYIVRKPCHPRYWFYVLSALPPINVLFQRASCGEIPYCSP